MFVVVVFENNQVECVPLKWLEGQAKVYWPPFKSKQRIVTAVKNKAKPDAVTWPSFKIRCLPNSKCYKVCTNYYEVECCNVI